MNKEDKIKVRTATKCYLKLYNKGTANQIWSFINSCDLKLRAGITPSILARELSYCTKTKNFLNITSIKDKTNRTIYKLED